jgi:hypothetical protein
MRPGRPDLDAARQTAWVMFDQVDDDPGHVVWRELPICRELG